MKTIEFKSNYGNFAYRMTAEVGDEVNESTTALCVEGLANICYRVAGSAVDKALGVKKGEGRKALAYVPSLGDEVDAAVSKKLKELEGKEVALTALKLSFMVTGQHVFGEGSDAPTKEATEMWTKVQALTETPAELATGMAKGAKFEKALAALGLAEDYTDESGILACKAKLTAAKLAAKQQAAALLGV